jgi:hypothetical protein
MTELKKGKWYGNNRGGYMKCHSDRDYHERIWNSRIYEKTSGTVSTSWKESCVEVSVKDIQHLLPEGHPDIVTEFQLNFFI